MEEVFLVSVIQFGKCLGESNDRGTPPAAWAVGHRHMEANSKTAMNSQAILLHWAAANICNLSARTPGLPVRRR